MKNLQVDTTDYSQALEHDLHVVKYQFRAICTSDECRLASKVRKSKRTDAGTVKNVDKKSDWCPDCGEALFWEKTVA